MPSRQKILESKSLLKFGDKMGRFNELKRLNKAKFRDRIFLFNRGLLEVAMVFGITAVVGLNFQKTNCIRYFQWSANVRGDVRWSLKPAVIMRVFSFCWGYFSMMVHSSLSVAPR